jgi:hypothetical protein
MIKTYLKIKITETARNNPKKDVDQDKVFNHIEHNCNDIHFVKDYLTDHYGKMPSMKKKIYYDPDAEVIGFIHSFWNRDISHNSKAWWQTDWVCITKVTEDTVLL